MICKPVEILITTTGRNSFFFEQLLIYLTLQMPLVNDIYVICDGSLTEVDKITRGHSLSVKCIENPQKCSLTRRQNGVIGSMNSKFVLMLNDDVVLEKNFLKELLAVMEKYDEVGISCGKLMRTDKRTIDTTGQFLGKSRKPVERGFGVRDKGQYEQPGFVFGACGAAVLYRKKMLEDIAIAPGEYFDNDYHMFYEDLDISWRARNFGWKAYYNPKAIAWHQRGATAKEKKPFVGFLQSYNFAWLNTRLKSDLIKNRYMTIVKNDRFWEFLKDLPYVFIYDLRIFLYCLFFAPKVIFNSIKNIPFLLRAFKKRKLLEDKMRKTK